MICDREPAVTFASIDFETRSACNLKQAGAHRYSQDPSTGIYCLAWALDDDPISIWYPGDRDPHKLLDHIESGGVIRGWNIGGFEKPMWDHVVARICPRWPALNIKQLDDTMARAYARALPGKLEECAIAVGVKQQKDMAGHRLMMQMCVPTKEWRHARDKGLPIGPPVFIEDRDKIERLGEYCAQDVRTERELAKYIAPLSASEREMWLLDYEINNRGVNIDAVKVEGALAIAEAENKRLTKELQKITKCEGFVVVTPEKTTKAGKFIPEKRKTLTRVESAKSSPQMLAWLEHHELKLPNLKKKKLDRLVREERAKRERREGNPLPDNVFRVLEIRLEIAKASNAKLSAMLKGRSLDGRCRQLFSYHVATTGRWAGRRVQLQDMPRPDFPGIDEKYFDNAIEEAIGLFDQPHGKQIISWCIGDPLPTISSCLRGLLIPGPGKQYIGADFAGIEGRVIAWLGGEEWKLQAYRDLDAGIGHDMYKLAYSRSFGVGIEDVTKPQRQIGKVEELALGFQGSVGAFAGMADNLGVILPDIARIARDASTPDAWRAAAEWFPKDKDKTFGLDSDTWTGIKVIVDAWRAAHPATKALWYDLENCAIAAIEQPKTVKFTETKRIKFVSDRQFLYCQLPSNRILAYAKPSVAEVPTRSGKSTKLQLRYYGQGKKSKKWEERRSYGGHLAENATQATARDVLGDAMKRLERSGYPIVIHVHDEPVAEVPLGFGSADEFKNLMCASAPWLAGCPINANSWAGHRFGK